MFGFHVTADNLVVLTLLIITACCLGALIIDYPDPKPVENPVEPNHEIGGARQQPMSSI